MSQTARGVPLVTLQGGSFGALSPGDRRNDIGTVVLRGAALHGIMVAKELRGRKKEPPAFASGSKVHQ